MVTYTYTGHPQGNINFDFTNQCVCCAATIDTLTAQQLVDGAREAEDSAEGIVHQKIIDAAGKDALGGGVSVGITVTLLNSWQVDSLATSGTFTYTDGNLVQDSAESLFLPNTSVTYVYLGAVATSIAEQSMTEVLADLTIINQGVQKASKSIPHNTDL